MTEDARSWRLTRPSHRTERLISISVSDGDKTRAAAMATPIQTIFVILQDSCCYRGSQRPSLYDEQLKQSRDALVTAALAFQQVQHRATGFSWTHGQGSDRGSCTLRAQVAAKQVEMQALRSYSTERNPSVQLAERQLTALQTEETRLELRSHSPGIAGLGLAACPVRASNTFALNMSCNINRVFTT